MIRQFDVFPNPVVAIRDRIPFVVCIQHVHLDYLATRLMAPLANEGVIRGPSKLNPAFQIAGQFVYLLPQDLLALPIRMFGESIANLAADRDRIVAAIDLVFTGI